MISSKDEYKIVGIGNYSIVIRPIVNNILNWNWFYRYLDKNDDDVCKILKYDQTNMTEFNNEFDMLMKINNIENSGTFTVPLKGACKISALNFRDEPDIRNKLGIVCDTVELYQIIFGYGGCSIRDISTPVSFPFFVELLRQFYKGIQSLHDNDIIHRDINPNNVLFDGKQLNLIDFGISTTVKSTYDMYDSEYILSFMYVYNPPEFYLAYLIHNEMKLKYSFDEALLRVFKKLTTFSSELRNFYDVHYHRYHRYHRYNKSTTKNCQYYIEEFCDFYQQIKERDIHSFGDLFTKELTYKSDVFSTSFIIRSFQKHIKYKDDSERMIYKELFKMTSSINPYNRSSINDILSYLDVKC